MAGKAMFIRSGCWEVYQVWLLGSLSSLAVGKFIKSGCGEVYQVWLWGSLSSLAVGKFIKSGCGDKIGRGEAISSSL